MIADREIAEYRSFCAALESLRLKYLERREELRRLLGETLERKRFAFKSLAKAGRLARRLTGRQRQISGVSLRLGEISGRAFQAAAASPALFQDSGGGPGGEFQGGPAADSLGLRELRKRAPLVLAAIDRVRQGLLQLAILEQRCRELIASINKALEAFRSEFRIIYRKIHPYGVFSVLNRSLRRLFGGDYFSFRDMDDMAALGDIAGSVLKIAESPVV